MEFLIPGLALVALMAYLSTRIKRTAAAAFDAEAVETDEFSIQKPDGFLNVIGARHVFEAYSKDFGTVADKTRLATAKVTVSDTSIADAVEAIDDEILSDTSEVIGERHYRVIEARRIVDIEDYRVYHKLGQSAGRTYIFEIEVLAEASREFIQKVEAMLASFELK